MYPDYISAKKMKENYEGNVFSPMGCRSFLSPWKDENGEYKFEGRFNQGVVSINLPQIGIIANKDEDKFFKSLKRALFIQPKFLLRKKDFTTILKSGEYIYKENDTSRDVYYIFSGNVQLIHSTHVYNIEKGNFPELKIIKPDGKFIKKEQLICSFLVLIFLFKLIDNKYTFFLLKFQLNINNFYKKILKIKEFILNSATLKAGKTCSLTDNLWIFTSEKTIEIINKKEIKS